MILVVNELNRANYRSYLRELMQREGGAFAGGLAYDVPGTAGILYLLSIDDAGRLDGAMRLEARAGNPLPGSGDFSQAVEADLVAGRVWKVSHVHTLSGRPALGVQGALEGGFAASGRSIQCIASMALFPSVLESGWDVTPLGLPDYLDGELALPIRIGLDGPLYSSVGESCGFDEHFPCPAPVLAPELEIAV